MHRLTEALNLKNNFKFQGDKGKEDWEVRLLLWNPLACRDAHNFLLAFIGWNSVTAPPNFKGRGQFTVYLQGKDKESPTPRWSLGNINKLFLLSKAYTSIFPLAKSESHEPN